MFMTKIISMKKLLLLCCLLPLAVMAQIAPIKTQEKPGEFIWRCVYHDKPSDTYYLHAQSDNQFEDKVMRVKLGDNSTEAVQSLANFLAAFNDAGKQFTVGTCTFIVATSGNFVRVLNRGQLEYTAGNYYIQKQNIKEAIVFMVSNRGADAGRTVFYADNLSAGKLRFYLMDYNCDGWLNFNSNLKPFLSNKYKKGEALKKEDVCALRSAMMNGQILHSNILECQCKEE